MQLSIIFQLIFKVLSIENSRVPNAPFLILIFYKFLGYESKMIKSTVIRFSKKLLNLIINRLKKSYGPGLSHFYATTIWNSVPILMVTPVIHLVRTMFRKIAELSNEVLCILAGQRAAKLPGVKVWDLKINLTFWVRGYNL